jgi:hypothetical protein
MSIDGLMPPNLVNMTAMIRDFSAYEGFCAAQVFERALISKNLSRYWEQWEHWEQA